LHGQSKLSDRQSNPKFHNTGPKRNTFYKKKLTLVPTRQTAAGFPPKGLFVKASTTNIGRTLSWSAILIKDHYQASAPLRSRLKQIPTGEGPGRNRGGDWQLFVDRRSWILYIYLPKENLNFAHKRKLLISRKKFGNNLYNLAKI